MRLGIASGDVLPWQEPLRAARELELCELRQLREEIVELRSRPKRNARFGVFINLSGLLDNGGMKNSGGHQREGSPAM